MEKTQQPSGNGGTAPPGSQIAANPFAASGLFVKTADIWTPYKMSYEGFAGGGKSTTMACVAVGLWEAEGRKGNVILIDTERSAKFILPFVAQFGLIEGKNFFVTHSRDLRVWGEVLKTCEANRGSILMTDTVTHIYEEMLIQFERDNKRKVKYPQDAMVIKPMWKEKFSIPFTNAVNTHLLFTGRAAWEYTMQTDEDTGKKEFNATGVKMRGDNELAYEPDVVVYMERLQKVENGAVMVARGATILKDRSRQIDGQAFVFKSYDENGQVIDEKAIQAQVWKVFEPVYRVLASGNKDGPTTEPDRQLGPLFQKGQGEAWYQQRVFAERIVEEIKEIYSQWGMGGTSGVEKMLRALINLIVFKQRSTVALAELHPDELKSGVDKLEHLVRFAAKNSEVIEKMFKAGQYDGVHELMTGEYKTFQASRPSGPAMDDDIPEFSTKRPAAETPHVLCMDEIIVALGEQLNERAVDTFVAENAGVISKLDMKSRKKIENAVNKRKRDLEAEAAAAQAS